MMSQESEILLYSYRELAMRVLGLPTTRPYAHKDIAVQFQHVTQMITDPVARDALLVIELLAYEWVDARGWQQSFLEQALAPPLEEEQPYELGAPG